MQIIAGLGNPGQTYQNNRHNIGFMAADAIHAGGGFSPWREKFQALIAEGALNKQKLLLVKPQTYMNNSGQSLAAILQFYKLTAENISVFHDELDLSPGKIKIKTGGGSGGHNGIKSIDAHCGKNYRRIRLGIGHPGHEKELVHHYVMGNFSKAEQEWLMPMLDSIGRNAAALASGDTNGFMNKIFTETHDTSGTNGHVSANKQSGASAKPETGAPLHQASAAAKPQSAMAEKLKKLFGGPDRN